MPAILTHTAIMLLARDRIEDIRNRLLWKQALATVPLTDLELRLLHLAKLAHAMMSDTADDRGDPARPEPDWPKGIGGASRFAVMGSMGPDIPGMAAVLAPSHGVWFDTVHKGTPDSNREQIDARTHAFALQIWEGARHALTSRPSVGPDNVRANERARNQIRAYVLGHLTHVAGDIIAHPFINDVEWHVPRRQPPGNPLSFETFKFGHEKTEGSLDTRVAIEFFRREGPRSGQPWSAMWPTLDEVPPELFTGWELALKEIYRISPQARSKGLAAFEAEVQTPPVPDADFIKDGYRMLTKGGVGIMYNWGYASWFGFLSLALLPLMATMPLTFALPRGKLWFEKRYDEAGEQAAFEAFTLPIAMNSLWPAVYCGIIGSVTVRGAEAITTTGLIGSAFASFFSFIFFITLLAPDPGAGFRWIFLLILPAAFGFAVTVAAIRKKVQKEKRRARLLAIIAAPFIFAVISGVLLVVFAEVIGSESETAGVISWSIVAALIGLAGLVLLIWLPFKLRDMRLPEKALALPTERPHNVRLFDRSSLFTMPNQQDVARPEEHYPSGVRPLLKLWWTGAGEFFIRPRRTHLEYAFVDNSNRPGIIPAPITPMKLSELASYLTNAVRDSANAAGVLQCALVHPDDADVELPPGAVFADHGDLLENRKDETPEFAQAEAASKYTKLSRANNDESYVLQHAPKRAQAVRFDRFGPAAFEERENELVNGGGTISGSGTTITGSGTSFRFFFQPGDRIVFNGQSRIVTKVDSDVSLVIASPFRPAPDAADYQRLGTLTEQQRGYTFVAQPPPRSGTSETIMDLAGDLGALFCMAGASHMIDSMEGRVRDLDNLLGPDGNPVPSAFIAPVAAVFNNWSLDRRLVDEWRTAVLGGATIDNRAAADAGQRTLAQQGWVQTLRKWLRVIDVTDASAVDATRRDAGVNEPTNQELSLAMAKLMSMTDPIVVTPRP